MAPSTQTVPNRPLAPDALPAFSAAAPFRLVLPRAKQERLAQQIRRLPARRGCPVPGCNDLGLSVVLVETERDAILCPRHLLVSTEGVAEEGQPLFVTRAW